VTAVVLAGCSSQPPEYQPPPGALVAGTAQVTVNGQDTGTTDAVQCDSAGTLMIINTGDRFDPQASGISAMVASEDELVVREVGIRNLGGFTGSYNDGLGGEA
jgi:ipoprotein LpqH